MYFYAHIFLNMKKNVLFIILLFISLASYAQGEANIWYFGNNAGLDFNSTNPVVLTDGKMNTVEGCATISNFSGDLLFYTDGVTLWNKNHQIMPNGMGLLGDSSSTQSAIIVPNPANSTIYYLFTTSQANLSTGIRYSEVDLTLNGGLGDVTVNKNIALVEGEVSEKLTAIKNSSGTGYWVMSHGFLSNSFLAYQVTASGVNVTPVVSTIGSFFDKYNSKFGYLKFSPDGSKLANTESTTTFNGIEIFDFDNSTGILSNYRNFSTPNYFNYGLEFSPSGNLIYTASYQYIDFYHQNHKISQYDLTASDIIASEVVLYTATTDQNFFIGALQLAPDNKIYISMRDLTSTIVGNYISRIENPNTYGTGSDFVLRALDLSPNKCQLGLPQFIQSYFNVGINVQNNCLGEATAFTLSGNQVITSASWDFGDGTTSSDINPTHIYASTGNYTVAVTAISASGTDTKTRNILVSAIPIASKPQDLLVCDTNNDGIYTFDLSSQNVAILSGQDPSLFAVNYFVNNVSITTPSGYVNSVPYQQEIISAEVSNKANSSCKSTASFNIDVFDVPKPITTIPKISLCDNSSVGTDSDGRVSFDLNQRATAILNGQSLTQFTLSFYKDAALTQRIGNASAYQNTNATETVYVKIANKDLLNCTAVTSFPIEVLALPTITNVADLKQCDDDTDGFSVFNLEEAIAKITPNSAVETISFHETIEDAQKDANPILNRTTYTNQTVSTDVVFVRVSNSNACFRIAQLNLTVSTTQIPISFKKTFIKCDDSNSGSNTDGIAAFDLSVVDNDIKALFPSGQLLDISYYKNITDALVEKNGIADIANYSNIGYPNTQNIYIRVDSRLNNDCLGLGSYITLKVESIRIVAPLPPYVHCDDDQDGFYTFDVTGLDTQLKNGKDVLVTYFDANNNPLPSPLPNPFVTASQTVQATITNNTTAGCSYNISIPFIVDDLPQAFPVPTSLTTVCDDEIDPSQQDGKYAFDTSTFQTTILSGQTGRLVYYFDKNNSPLPSPLPNPFITSTQNVRVEVVNPSNTNCKATTTIPFVVHQIPNILLEGDELVCSNLPTFTKVINAGIQDATPITTYTYAWSFDGQPITAENNYALTVNTEGIYTVKVTNNQGCSRTRTISVAASDVAVITNVAVVDLSDSNSITILVSGSGDYAYSLDEEYGTYQTENYFTNVNAGIHTVFVKDLNGCGVTAKEVAVLGIPNYFTPNQDGYNDTWNIKGVNASFNAKTVIYIFDRYGKLITQINPTSQGWNGTFNGQQMPATDYWYSVQLEDGRIIKGHFALKR